MFFPIRTDRRLHHTPWLNYALVAANLIVFAATHEQITGINEKLGKWDFDEIASSYPVFRFYLLPVGADIHQFISYQFLHAGLWHLLGNMLFLFVFGNSVEDRLGKIGYLAFYLGGGAMAGLGHCLTSDMPVLGASGSVAAMTGAYLVLFPLSNVTIVYFMIFIGTFEVSSILLILFQIGQNIVMHLMGDSGVAYMAHLSGYVYGLGIAMALLAVRLLPREPYDLLALIERRRRRAQFARTTRDGHHPWSSAPKTARGHGQNGAAPVPNPTEQQLMELRKRISDFLDGHNLGHAAHLYTELLQIDSDQVMGQPQQLDIANQLMSEGRYDTAARAYELFLNRFRSYDQREQVELILALIYVKYLDRGQRARELLSTALPRLRNDEQKRLARELLEDIEP